MVHGQARAHIRSVYMVGVLQLHNALANCIAVLFSSAIETGSITRCANVIRCRLMML